MSLGMVGLGPCTRFCVRWRPSSPPQFSAYVHCGQTAGWIKTTLGTKMGLGPGHIVLHGDPVPPPRKRHSPSNFRPICCGQMAGRAVATFEATEAAASAVFTTLASVKNNYFDQLNFKYESRESRLYCRNS